MKFIYAFFLLNLLATNILAQKNELRLSPYFQAKNDVNLYLGASLSYFRSIAPHRQIGAKINFGTDALEATQYDVRHYDLSMDVLNRWNTSGKSGQFYFDLGFSILGQTDRIKPGTYKIKCDLGFTEAQIQEIEQLYKRGTTGNRFYLGFASAVGFDVRLGPRFLIGANTSCNVYHFENAIRPRFNPGLSITRQF